MLSRKLKDDFYWVGMLDPDLEVFDIIMYTEFGTSYNSYILKGRDKTVLFEASKTKMFDEYMAKINEIVPFEEIDFLVCNHTEPDHSGSIEKMLEVNPNLQIVATKGALNFLAEITNKNINGMAVKDGDEISIGNKTLKFIVVPNLHWPDSMFTYIPEDNILVSCDVFGAHYSHAGIINDEALPQDDYMKAARYYFDCIFAPFKADVLKACDKISDFEIEIVANGHGPVIVNNPNEIIETYKKWASEPMRNDKKTVVIPYVSAYGYTQMLAESIRDGILSTCEVDVKLFDMITENHDEVMGEIYLSDGILLGTPTLVGDALPPIWNIATSLNSKIHGGKFVGVFGSYGWSGEGVPNIMNRLRQLKVTIVGEGMRVRFKPNEENLTQAYEYGKQFAKTILAGKLID